MHTLTIIAHRAERILRIGFLAAIVLLVLACEGSQGPAGPAGPQGKVGPAGAVGEQGLEGAQGKVGPAGAVGKQGPEGAQGQSGPQGEHGEQGSTGPQGPKGDRGPEGSAADAQIQEVTQGVEDLSGRVDAFVERMMELAASDEVDALSGRLELLEQNDATTTAQLSNVRTQARQALSELDKLETKIEETICAADYQLAEGRSIQTAFMVLHIPDDPTFHDTTTGGGAVMWEVMEDIADNGVDRDIYNESDLNLCTLNSDGTFTLRE